MQSDKPTAEDRLGFEPYVRGVEDLIRATKPEDLPLTVGIYGSWGSGKTSFMLQLKKRLDATTENTTRIPTIWFEAWKYDRAQDVRSALVNKILTEIRDTAPTGLKDKLTEQIKRVGKLLFSVSAKSRFALGVPGLGTLNLLSSEELAQSYLDDMTRFQTDVDELAGAFAGCVQTYLEELSKHPGHGVTDRLVVFIDDLDRCLPENVIIGLEALKLFLTGSPCVFVLGVDRTIVDKAVQNHYGSDPGVGREYLDKIIQCSFNVPPADSKNLTDLFTADVDENCLHVFKCAAQGNPRAYLRLLSVWNLVSSLAPHVTPDLWKGSHRHVLAIATAIRVRFPLLYEVCQNNPPGLPTFFQCFLAPPSKESTTSLLSRNTNAPDYAQFGDNGILRQFVLSLKGPLGQDITAILGTPDKLEQALRLSASVK